jgi:hypothetical protein
MRIKIYIISNMAEEPVFDVTFSLVYVVAFIAVAILIFSFPFGFVPGTDLYAIRQYKCVDYLKKTKAPRRPRQGGFHYHRRRFRKLANSVARNRRGHRSRFRPGVRPQGSYEKDHESGVEEICGEG